MEQHPTRQPKHWRIWGGGGGGMPGTRHPLWDPILLFLHTFSPKSAHVGGPHPPNGCMPPLWEILDPPLLNPATLSHNLIF